MNDKERIQLNLRLDGNRELLEAVKEAASAAGISVNAWVIRQLQVAVNQSPIAIPAATPEATSMQMLDTMLDTTLDSKLDKMLEQKLAPLLDKLQQQEERLGKLRA